MAERMSRVRRGPPASEAAQASACCRGGHDWHLGRSPESGITYPAAMFLNQPSTALWVLTGPPGFRLNKHFDRPGGQHPKQTKAQETAKLMHTRIAHAAPTPGHAHSKPNLVAGSRAVHTLQHELKTEGRLELADHHDWRLLSAQHPEERGDECKSPKKRLRKGRLYSRLAMVQRVQSMLRFTNIREILFELIKGARESGPQLSLSFAAHLTPHRVGTAQCLLLLGTRLIRSR